MDIDILGIDLAKRVFQLHGADRSGRALHRAKVTRDRFVEAMRLGVVESLMKIDTVALRKPKRDKYLPPAS